MSKKHYYMVLDTETSTVPFINEYAMTEKQRQTIAISKPLVYDIGWTICDRLGNIVSKKNYLVQEIFFAPAIMEKAYYFSRYPMYMAMFRNGEITSKLWNDIIPELITDASNCQAVCAYNAAFDFKKAIPYTERFIEALYTDMKDFERRQRYGIKKTLEGKNNASNPTYTNPVFKIRENEFPIIDLWQVACDRLINIPKYKKFCADNRKFTNSVEYFKTSAEVCFQYLEKQYDFEESHTALADSEIETLILAKGLKKGKIEPCLGVFPFRNLGTTFDFAIENIKYIDTVIEMLNSYIADNCTTSNSYWARMENALARLEAVRENAV